MADYPYLPELGECDALGIQRDTEDSTIGTQMQNGMVQTRPGWKRLRRLFVVPYKFVSEAARNTLDDFVRNTVVGASGIWVWVDPLTDEGIKVRFQRGKLPKPQEGDVVAGAITYSFQLELEEV
jgi:hypothetical protein